MISSRTKQGIAAALGFLGLAILVAVGLPRAGAEDKTHGGTLGKGWEAVAPGLVEPESGDVKLMAPVIGRISQVLVKANDKVIADEPLVRLDDAEARVRVATARATVAMRRRARNDQAAGKAADRRRAEDLVADAEADVVAAREAFDNATAAKRAGSGSDADVASTRADWTKAQDELSQQQGQLRKIEADSGTPLPTLSEGQLNISRTELRLAIVELEKLTIRAPTDSTVLQVNAKVGELAAPPTSPPLVTLGDLSALRVRAELDERDVGEIKLGHKVVVRTDAFRGREFAGKVSTIAPIVQAARISSPGSRNLTDFSVAEILIDLDDPGPLVVGMKVDVYFQAEAAAQ